MVLKKGVALGLLHWMWVFTTQRPTGPGHKGRESVLNVRESMREGHGILGTRWSMLQLMVGSPSPSACILSISICMQLSNTRQVGAVAPTFRRTVRSVRKCEKCEEMRECYDCQAPDGKQKHEMMNDV